MSPRKYRNPPIEEAICDIQFTAAPDWDPTIPGRMLERLKSFYSEKPRRQDYAEPRAVDEQGADVGKILFQQKSRIQFLAENGTRVLSVSDNQITIHMVRPYTGWETFRPRVEEAVNAYAAVASPTSVDRIGLRYVNRIVFGREDVRLEDYFSHPPRFPEIEPTRPASFFHRTESVFLDTPIRLNVTLAELEAKSPQRRSYLLDVEIVRKKQEEAMPLPDVMTAIDDLKDRHRRAFESLITDRTRELFDAV